MKTLIALDLRPHSAGIVREAASRPRPAKSQFLLLHVLDPYPFAKMPISLKRAKNSALEQLSEAAQPLLNAGWKTDTDVVLGRARQAISKIATSWKADFVLVGTSGEGALMRVLLGSTARSVLRQAPCSVEITSESPSVFADAWLDLVTAATIERTSEDKTHPIEAALSSRDQGWRAASPGAQTIRLIFYQPRRHKRINLVFKEAETSRTQEFVLRWRSEADQGFSEIVRQQWNFSPPQAGREIEDYRIDLANVKILELAIIRNIGGRSTLRRLKICGWLNPNRNVEAAGKPKNPFRFVSRTYTHTRA